MIPATFRRAGICAFAMMCIILAAAFALGIPVILFQGSVNGTFNGWAAAPAALIWLAAWGGAGTAVAEHYGILRYPKRYNPKYKKNRRI